MFVLRICALIGAGTSVALLLDYTSAQPAFCGVQSGCSAIRASGFGYLPLPGGAHLPIPVLGVLAFGALLAASLSSVNQRRKMLPPLGYTFGAVGLGFFWFQAFLGHFCSLCVVVDSAALLSGLCVFALGRRDGFVVSAQDEALGASPQAGAPILSFKGWIGLSVLAVAAPLLFPQLVATSEVPRVIVELYDPTKVTVVEFFDYECPHCRDLSPRLKKIAQTEEDTVLRLGYTPLPGHQKAYQAARVTLCSGEQGREMEVASLLFQARDLSLENVTALAQGVVPDGAALSACLESRRPDERIEDDTRRLTEAGFEGLPTTYIGATRIAGALEDAVYWDAIRRAKAGTDTQGLNPWVYWLAVLAAALGVIMLARRQSAPDSKNISA